MTLSETDKYPKPLPIAATKQFLSRIPSRHPMDKIHKQVNHAKSAVNNFFNGYKGDALYHPGNDSGFSYGRFTHGWDDRNAKFGHGGCEMEIYELVDGAWSLLYTIKRGDVELPWKKGELAENIEKVNRMLDKEERELTAHIRALALIAHSEDEDSIDMDEYVKAFDKGYRKGMGHKK